MFKKILVPLDGSALAELALQTAVPLAQQTQGEIVLLQATTTHAPIYPTTPEVTSYNLYVPEEYTDDQATELSQEYLRQICDGKRRSVTDITWHTRVENGDPASTIVDMAQEEQVDLIIMSTHGRSGVGRWVMGSVTEKVLRNAPCPVLVIRSKRPLQKILITLDGSDLAEQSLPYGLAVAKAFDAKATLLQVQTNASLLDLEAAALLDAYEYGLGERYMRGADEEVSVYLESVWHDWRQDGVALNTAVREGKPAQTILDYAQQNEIDLIAMTTHGHTGLRRWAYGSVTEKVLRGSECALLVVRSPSQ